MKLQDKEQQKNELKKTEENKRRKKWQTISERKTKQNCRRSPKSFRGVLPRRRVKTVQEGVARWAAEAIELIKIIIDQK